MSRGLRRGLADLACRLLQSTLPPALRQWGDAIRCETAVIPNDTSALLFALGSLCGLLPRALASRLRSSTRSLTGNGAHHPKGFQKMGYFEVLLRHPRTLGACCASGAVALGLVYLSMAGAPTRYLAVNAIALIVGLAILALPGRVPATRGWWMGGGAIVAMAGTLLATALLAAKAEGAARWISAGGLSLQPSLILMPLMLVTYSRTRGGLATAGMVAAAAAVALQPDRAMAGVLLMGTGALALVRPERNVIAAFLSSAGGLVVTLLRADTLPAVPFVDQVLFTAFDVHAAAGLAVVGGSMLLLIPAVAGWSFDPARRAVYVTFGAAWFAAILAAALGNYPTPIVGYGGSAIIGYLLGLLALPRWAGARGGATVPSRGDETRVDPPLLLGIA